jgi:tRNA uridine 5-carboxymethylaminomethyl modification enzyme
LLRHDNADLRLTPTGYDIGLITEARYKKFVEKRDRVEAEINRLKETKFRPDETVQAMLAEANSTPLTNTVDGLTLLRRPELNYGHLESLAPSPISLSEDVKEQVEIQVKYTGYIEKQQIQVDRMERMEKKRIPDSIDYDIIYGLAMEAKQKLSKIRPLSIGQASRISGVTPADLSILLVHLEHYNRVTAAAHGS